MENDIRYVEICKKLGCEKICKNTELAPAELSDIVNAENGNGADPFAVLDIDDLLYLIENDYI